MIKLKEWWWWEPSSLYMPRPWISYHIPWNIQFTSCHILNDIIEWRFLLGMCKDSYYTLYDGIFAQKNIFRAPISTKTEAAPHQPQGPWEKLNIQYYSKRTGISHFGLNIWPFFGFSAKNTCKCSLLMSSNVRPTLVQSW